MGKLVCGIGYDSKSKGYKKTENRSHTKPYTLWKDMLLRCYSPKGKYYGKCRVEGSWLDFQNFAEWAVINYTKGLVLDKDILGDGSLYSESTCAFIPQALNLFTTHTKGKSKLGVCLNKRSGTYTAYCNDGDGKTLNLGSDKDEKVCQKYYLDYKKKVATKLANKYLSEGVISNEVFKKLTMFDINIQAK